MKQRMKLRNEEIPPVFPLSALTTLSLALCKGILSGSSLSELWTQVTSQVVKLSRGKVLRSLELVCFPSKLFAFFCFQSSMQNSVHKYSELICILENSYLKEIMLVCDFF